MSTKIYDGKIFKVNTIAELNRWYRDMKKVLVPAAQKELYKLIASIAQDLYVYLKFGINDASLLDIDYSQFKQIDDDILLPLNKQVLNFAVKAARNKVKACESSTLWTECTPKADFRVSVSVLSTQTKTLVIPFATNSDLFKILCSSEAFAEYGYWDNTDPLENISDEEWNQRKLDWDEALPSIGIPSENGCTITLVNPIADLRFCCGMKQILPYLIDDMSLAKNVAERKIIEEYGDYFEAKKAMKENSQILTDKAEICCKELNSKAFFRDIALS